MEQYFAKVSEEGQNHLKQFVGTVNLSEGEDALEMLAKGWLDKEESFMSRINERNLEEARDYSVEEELLSDVTQIIMDEFVEVNKTLIID